VIDGIDALLDDGTVDKDAWNVYVKKYHEMNRILNAAAKEIADSFGGVPITATTGITVKNVEDYYGLTVSQSVIAENAGLGWRGKSELVVNEKYSCAIRFSSVITSLPLIHGRKVKTSCGQCEACLEVCSVLKNKDKFENYRENCRTSMAQLGLDNDVCGKCIKACYRNSTFSDRFKLR
jgi:epoxyqueuosine reductase